jgi:anti-anti-sigma factor
MQLRLEGARVLTVSIRRDRERNTVVPVGDIDLSTVDTLAAQLGAAIDSDASRIEVDLSGVTFVDSVGIHALLKGRRLADASGKDYAVNGADGIVRQVLELTGVWTHLTRQP